MPLTDEERAKLSALAGATAPPVPQSILAAGSPAATPPGLTLEGMTLGRTPSLRFGTPKAEPSAELLGQKEATKKAFESGQKLATAIRRLDVIQRQYQSALPSQGRSPLEQRIRGTTATLGAKTGLAPNPKLLALTSNIRPLAINIVRSFGEVGNLSESEQKGAIQVFEQAGLTDEERLAKLRQFAEFALAGAEPEVKAALMQKRDMQQIVQRLGINLDGGTPPSTPTPAGSGRIMVDGNGRKAIVYPDGRYERIP